MKSKREPVATEPSHTSSLDLDAADWAKLESVVAEYVIDRYESSHGWPMRIIGIAPIVLCLGALLALHLRSSLSGAALIVATFGSVIVWLSLVDRTAMPLARWASRAMVTFGVLAPVLFFAGMDDPTVQSKAIPCAAMQCLFLMIVCVGEMAVRRCCLIYLDEPLSLEVARQLTENRVGLSHRARKKVARLLMMSTEATYGDFISARTAQRAIQTSNGGLMAQCVLNQSSPGAKV